MNKSNNVLYGPFLYQLFNIKKSLNHSFIKAML